MLSIKEGRGEAKYKARWVWVDGDWNKRKMWELGIGDERAEKGRGTRLLWVCGDWWWEKSVRTGMGARGRKWG